MKIKTINMNKNNRIIKNIIIIFLLMFPLTAIFSQQDIPRIGVVDTSAIYIAYFDSTTNIRIAKEIQNDIEEESVRIRNEITELKNRKLEAEQAQNTIEALRLTNLIEEKEQYLNDYIQIKNDRIIQLISNDAMENSLYTEITAAIRHVAFKKGYTIILEKQNPIFLYYSVEIDITEEVLEYLLSLSEDD